MTHAGRQAHKRCVRACVCLGYLWHELTRLARHAAGAAAHGLEALQQRDVDLRVHLTLAGHCAGQVEVAQAQRGFKQQIS